MNYNKNELKMQDTPLVSIVIPVYNGSKYMKEAINSALNQTYPNIEVIVVNDGSNDNGETEKNALEYGNKIRYIKKENGGVSSALNVGIQNMNGEYFSWLSHDDIYLPDKVEKQIAILKKYDMPYAVVKSFTNFIDKDSKILNYKTNSPYEKVLSWDDAAMYVTQSGLNGCTLLIHKNIFLNTGGFDERLRYCQDTFMWWKIFLDGNTLIMCEHIGVYSRIHEKQLTRTGSALYHHDSMLISEIIIPAFVEKSTRNKNLLYQYAKEEVVHGNHEIMKNCIKSGKTNDLINFKDGGILFIWGIYGHIRPLIRKIYYKLIHGIRIK